MRACGFGEVAIQVLNARLQFGGTLTGASVEASFHQRVYFVLSLHQTGTPRETTLHNAFQINVPLSRLIDGTIIAIVLARKGNDSIK